MNNKKGFTLIEMLVVVAIIGILSAVVLVALGPSRDKAKDARIIAALQQARVIWETMYNATEGTYPPIDFGNPASLSTELERIRVDVSANNDSSDPVATSGNLFKSGAIYAALNGNGRYYCVDTQGFAGEKNALPAAPGSCD